MTSFQIQCPSCHAALTVPSALAGKNVRCTHCKSVLAVKQPTPQAAASEPLDASNFFGETDAAVTSFRGTSNSAQSSFVRPQQPAALEAKDKSSLPILVLSLGGVVALAVIIGGGIVFSSFVLSAATDVAEPDIDPASVGQSPGLRTGNPLPTSFQERVISGVAVRVPENCKVREVASPASSEMAVQVSGQHWDSEYRLFVMPLVAGEEAKRDQWLRNIFQYSGGKPEELRDVQRNGVPGKRIRLRRQGDAVDPLMEVFQFPDRMVVVSVTPPDPGFVESFFASLRFEGTGTDGDSWMEPQKNPAASTDPASTSAPDRVRNSAEARRKQIYLEYKKYASANTTRRPLPGVKVRDNLDALLGKINESQVQQFLIMNDLSNEELNQIVIEGNEKGWSAN